MTVIKLIITLFLFSFFLSLSGQKRKIEVFSINQPDILLEISQSPEIDLSIGVLDSTGVETARVVPLNEKFYYNQFLKSVHQLHSAVILKSVLGSLSGGHPHLRNNPAALLKIAKTVYAQAYNHKNYNALWNDVVKSYEMEEKKCGEPSDSEIEKSEQKYRCRRALYIMNNLMNQLNRVSNRALAKKGVKYFDEKVKTLELNRSN